jgi:hypothetical protein
MLALSLGWLGYGEHGQQENNHDFGAHFDLVGSNSLGYFYLAMRRGLDYLASLPQADTKRLGVTGLSGGGWQTTILSSFDERVAASAEVAGIGSMESNLTRPSDTAEVEEDGTDLVQGRDYSLFVALRAPRPTLLMHNAQDDCCFLASLVKPYIYDQVLPFFKLYGAENAFHWHENVDRELTTINSTIARPLMPSLPNNSICRQSLRKSPAIARFILCRNCRGNYRKTISLWQASHASWAIKSHTRPFLQLATNAIHGHKPNESN